METQLIPPNQRIVLSSPPPIPYTTDWASVVEDVKQYPGSWVLVARHVTYGTGQDLRRLYGVKYVMRNGYYDGPSRKGDLWLCWESK